MRKRLADMTTLTKMLLIFPLAILGMAIFCWIGGELVRVLWNWLAPSLFGLRTITFWEALGLLTLCRILFGGFGLGGGGNRNTGRRMGGRIGARVGERVGERMAERWEQMTDEERERCRVGLRDRSGRTTPLDSNQSA